MQNIATMIESGSIVVLSILVIIAVENRLAAFPRTKALMIGVIFTLVGLAVMENSVEVIPGIRVDPRAAVVTMSAALGGPFSALVTAPGLAFTRLQYGGQGAIPGAIYILGVAVAALVFRFWWFGRTERRFTRRYVLSQAAIAAVVPALILLLSSSAPWAVFLLGNALSAPTNFAAAAIMGIMLIRDRERSSALSKHQETRAQIDTIAGNAPVILFQMVLDTKDRPKFTFVSDAVSRILGVTSDSLVSRFEALGSVVTATAMASVEEKLKESRADWSPWKLELECIRPDGHVIAAQIDAGIRADPSGRPVWDGSISDVTERRRTDRLKDEFISTVSHELRTPLTSIRGSLGLLAGGSASQLPAKASGLVNIAHRNAERLTLLIDDILDMQKISSGQIRFTLSSERLRPILDQAVISAQNYAPEKKTRIALIDDAPSAAARVDPDRLAQVLGNLLSNAIKFSPDGTLVIVSVAMSGRHVRISVEDEGPGIPEDFRAKIFDRFSRAEDVTKRNVGGTGLGLNISHAIVETMGGRLWFDSVVGQGASFHIDLPAIEISGRPASTTSMPRVLLCGGDPQARQELGDALSAARLRVDVAPDAETAAELLRDCAYAALILEWATSSGPDLLASIRCDARNRALAVIAAPMPAADAVASATGGAVEVIDWLEMPPDTGRLKTAIRLAAPPGKTSSICLLHVGDNPRLRDTLELAIGDEARVTNAEAGVDREENSIEAGIDLMLLDLTSPSKNVLLPEVRREAPAIMVGASSPQTAQADASTEQRSEAQVPASAVVETVLAALERRSETIRKDRNVA